MEPWSDGTATAPARHPLMGRHGAGRQPEVPAAQEAPGARVHLLLRAVAERTALAAAGLASTTLVLAWAGVRWRTAVVVGTVVGLLVLAAASIAATVPSPPDQPPVDRRPGGTSSA